ncbi:MAG: hypothetical protein ACLFM1_08950 [Bacteroidales bacterium]
MRKWILILIVSIFCVFPELSAQEKENSTNAANVDLNKFTHGIGAAAGFTTGYGLSYRYYMDRWAFQGTFAPIVEGTNNMTFSTGLTFMYRLADTEFVNLYLYESNHWHYLKNEWDSNFTPYNSNEVHTNYSMDMENYIHSGIGVGFEFILWDRISFNLMTGYSVKYGRYHNIRHRFNDGELVEDNSTAENRTKIHPTIEGGLYYCF